MVLMAAVKHVQSKNTGRAVKAWQRYSYSLPNNKNSVHEIAAGRSMALKISKTSILINLPFHSGRQIR